jgi:hypothetical protein
MTASTLPTPELTWEIERKSFLACSSERKQDVSQQWETLLVSVLWLDQISDQRSRLASHVSVELIRQHSAVWSDIYMFFAVLAGDSCSTNVTNVTSAACPDGTIMCIYLEIMEVHSGFCNTTRPTVNVATKQQNLALTRFAQSEQL